MFTYAVQNNRPFMHVFRIIGHHNPLAAVGTRDASRGHMVDGPVGKPIYPRFGKRYSLTCIRLRFRRSLLEVVFPQRTDDTQMPASRHRAHTTDLLGDEVVATHAASFSPRIHDIVHL